MITRKSGGQEIPEQAAKVSMREQNIVDESIVQGLIERESFTPKRARVAAAIYSLISDDEIADLEISSVDERAGLDRSETSSAQFFDAFSRYLTRKYGDEEPRLERYGHVLMIRTGLFSELVEQYEYSGDTPFEITSEEVDSEQEDFEFHLSMQNQETITMLIEKGFTRQRAEYLEAIHRFACAADADTDFIQINLQALDKELGLHRQLSSMVQYPKTLADFFEKKVKRIPAPFSVEDDALHVEANYFREFNPQDLKRTDIASPAKDSNQVNQQHREESNFVPRRFKRSGAERISIDKHQVSRLEKMILKDVLGLQPVHIRALREALRPQGAVDTGNLTEAVRSLVGLLGVEVRGGRINPDTDIHPYVVLMLGLRRSKGSKPLFMDAHTVSRVVAKKTGHNEDPRLIAAEAEDNFWLLVEKIAKNNVR